MRRNSSRLPDLPALAGTPTFSPGLKGDRNPPLLPAVDELCSFEAYEFMRNGHRMSRAKATAALTAALTQLLTNERGTS